MMANVQRAAYLTLAAVSLLAGCSVLIESDKKQCTKDTQCSVPYVCGKQGLCEIKTGCTTSADCRQPGACIEGMCKPPQCSQSKEDCDTGELCNTELGTCVPEAEAMCTEAKDCQPYEGAQVCITSDKLCGNAECKVTKDCEAQSPTAVCNAGVCEDPTWGCLGQDDVRLANSSRMASWKVKVLYAYAQGGAMETPVKNLTWRVCQLGDPACDDDSKLVTTDVTYNSGPGGDNYLTVNGLQSGLNYRVLLRGEHPTKAGIEMIPTEFVMYRTVVEETLEPKPILMFEEAVRDTLSSVGEVPIDKTLGFLLMRIYDCTDTEVAGVQVASGTSTTGCGGECPTTIFYQNTSNLPDPGATETNSAGRAGILNLKTTGLNRITLTRSADNKKIASFVVTPRSGWLTYVYFWPWEYGTGAD